MKAAFVVVKFSGLSPQAMILQYGAPEPPEKRENWFKQEVHELGILREEGPAGIW